MLVALGYLIVLASVFGGYALAGGHLGAMYQPFELLIIGGAGLGAFIVGNPTKTLAATARALPGLLKGSKYNKELAMALIGLLYEILAKARKEGLMSIERDIDAVHESAIFSRYPQVTGDARLLEFITDYLRLAVSGNLNPAEIAGLMESEIDTFQHEGEIPAHALQKAGDALPAFGIVAAVMGVVHTMGSVGLPPAELGKLIAGALVGTFLGILLAYGFVGPLATLIEQKLAEAAKMLECVKVTLLANLNGYAPQLAVEFGRKVLFSTERPSFAELEAHVKGMKGK